MSERSFGKNFFQSQLVPDVYSAKVVIAVLKKKDNKKKQKSVSEMIFRRKMFSAGLYIEKS